MHASPRFLELAAVACLALGGCAGSNWLTGDSLESDFEAQWKPQKTYPARPVESVARESTPRAADPKQPLAKQPSGEKPAADKSPAATTDERNSSAARLFDELKSRGDLDRQTMAAVEQALRESDPAVRDLLVRTLLAAAPKSDRAPSAKESAAGASNSKRPDEAALSQPTKPPLHPGHDESPAGANPLRPSGDVAPASTALRADAPYAGSQRSEVSGQKSEVSGQRSEVSGQKSEVGSQAPQTEPHHSPVTTQQSPVSSHDWKEELALTIGALEAELAGKSVEPADRSRLEAQLRLLYVAAERRNEAAQPIRDHDEARREYWKSQVHALCVLLDPKGPPADDRRAALALRHVREAADHLAAGSALDVRNLAFVSRVDSFGRYTEFPAARFRPDQEVLLYVEVDNFKVEAKPQGYETALEGSYQIFDAGGQRVADHTYPQEKETCRRPRRDFFIPYRLYLPKSIPQGDYILHLTIKDVKGDKFGQGTLRFAIEQ